MSPVRCHIAICTAGAGYISYPYYYYWRAWLRGKLPVLTGPLTHPTLFVYGEEKPIQFHSASFLDSVSATPGGHVEAFRAGHWFVLTHADQLNTVLLAWLQTQNLLPSASNADVGTVVAST